MRLRLVLVFLAVVLMVSVLVNCESDNTDPSIDPCPGWSCFKVGNEWEYQLECFGEVWQEFVTADSIVFKDSTYFLALNTRTECPYLGIDGTQVLIRCKGGKVFIYDGTSYQGSLMFDLDVEEGHCFEWNYKADWYEPLPGEYPDSVCTWKMTEKDATFLTELGMQFKVCTFRNDVPPWWPPDPPIITYKINKDYGIVYSQSGQVIALSTETLVKFTNGQD
jgi:hypothetical protein